jgi:uncharacterized membrane protein YjgN (DUF898 family)
MSEPSEILTRGAAAAAASASPTTQSQEHAFQFDGRGGEYFRIWIVNLFLTIATLGIYSAWAKVRTQRYFAASTRLAGGSFDYLASPIAILKGRLLVLAFMGVYSGSSFVSVWLQGAMGFALFAAIPWAITRSLAFRAHNTAWRNIRFHFDASYGHAFGAYIGFPLLGVLSLGALYPFSIFRERKFVVENAAFGQTPFVMGSGLRDFYSAAIALLLQILLAGFVVTLATAGAAALGSEALAPVGLLLIVPFYFYIFAFAASRLTNLSYEDTQLGPHRLRSDLPAPQLAVTYATNAIAILASLGLMIPWAQIRMARLRLSHLKLQANGDLDAFVAGQASDVASFGSEVGEALGIDIGL